MNTDTPDLFTDNRTTVLEVQGGDAFLEVCERERAGEFEILSAALTTTGWRFSVRYTEAEA